MTWRTAPLSKVAPAQPADIHFDDNVHVWHLSLDQIESHTGYISEKKRAPASSAGTSTIVFDEGNVLYSKLRPYLNKVVRPDEPGVATTELVPLRPDPKELDPDFLTYYLRSPGFLAFAETCVAGAKMPRVIMKKFWEQEVPLPPLPEQRRIVAILDRADALRRKRAEADRLAARILPALFYEMFGDEENRFPKKKLERLLRDRKGALQSGPFGSNLHNSDFVPEGTVLAVGIDNVHDSGFELGRERRITEEKYSELAKYTLEPDDVLITIMGTVGRTCVFPDWAGLAICTKHVYRIQVREDEINPDYLCACFRFSPSARNQLGASTTGQVVEGITSKALRNLELKVPPIGLQREFSVRKAEMDAHLRLTDLAAENLNQLSHMLTHQAFAGEWRS